MLIFLPAQFVVQKVAQQMAARGECERELLPLADAFRRGGEESPQ